MLPAPRAALSLCVLPRDARGMGSTLGLRWAEYPRGQWGGGQAGYPQASSLVCRLGIPTVNSLWGSGIPTASRLEGRVIPTICRLEGTLGYPHG